MIVTSRIIILKCVIKFHESLIIRVVTLVPFQIGFWLVCVCKSMKLQIKNQFNSNSPLRPQFLFFSPHKAQPILPSCVRPGTKTSPTARGEQFVIFLFSISIVHSTVARTSRQRGSILCGPHHQSLTSVPTSGSFAAASISTCNLTPPSRSSPKPQPPPCVALSLMGQKESPPEGRLGP